MNLRKDHCRNLPSRTTREPVNAHAGASARRQPPPAAGGEQRLARLGETTNPGASCAKENQTRERAPAAPDTERERDASPSFNENPKRLSATDISALASMKNVAKCDTWCELQNPVNHRVFERKLRPKPSGRGHVCLGVTHRCPSHSHPASRGAVGRAETGLPRAPRSRLAQIRVFGGRAATIGGEKEKKTLELPSRARASELTARGPFARPVRGRSLRDPRSGGTTR